MLHRGHMDRKPPLRLRVPCGLSRVRHFPTALRLDKQNTGAYPLPNWLITVER